MFNSFARRLSRRIGHVLKFLAPDESDDSLLDDEKNLYKRNIIRAARSLEMFEEDIISPTMLAEAIERIGCLAYTGGPPANKCAGQYIAKFAELLRADVRNEAKLAILKALCTITVNHVEHQNLAHDNGLLTVVSDLIVKKIEGLQYWAIYCLFCMAIDNIRNLQKIKSDADGLHEALRSAVSGVWTGFRRNYADVLLKLAGLQALGRETKDAVAAEGKTGTESRAQTKNAKNRFEGNQFEKKR